MWAFKLILCFAITWTCTDGCRPLKRISGESDGGFLDCPAVDSNKDSPSLDACLKQACEKGANAVNFKGRECHMKSCRGADYAWGTSSGYNVYAIDMCYADFTLASPQSKGLASDCTTVAGIQKMSLTACRQYTCAKGANAFNFKGDTCHIKQCDGEDLKLTSKYGGYDVYYIAPPEKVNCYGDHIWSLYSPVSAGKSIECQYVTGFDKVSVEFCKKYACSNRYTAFNFKDNSCFIKQCDFRKDVALTEAFGGYDVYIINDLPPCMDMKKISGESSGGYLDCPSMGSVSVESEGECSWNACLLGANAYNLNGTGCFMKSCSGSSYAWNDKHGGTDVYTIDMCYGDFILASPQSKGLASGCTSVASVEKISLEACKQYTCAKVANVFNFKDNTCYIKRCESDDLKLTSALGGYDVYYIVPPEKTKCSTNFKLASPMSAGLATGCSYATEFKAVNLEFCKKFACANDYNAFNFKDNSCFIKQCESLDDLQLYKAVGGWDVYIEDEDKPARRGIDG